MDTAEIRRRIAVTYVVNPAALWFAMGGLCIQVASAILIFSGALGPSFLDITLLTYNIVTILLGLAGFLCLIAHDVGLIKFGSILLLISAIMPFATFWGFFAGSALMIGAAVTALATIRRQTKVAGWSEIISP
jgi:hypothetical protein